MKSFYSLVVLCWSTALFAQTATPTTAHSKSLFTWQDAVLGGAFIVGTVAVRPLDRSAALALQQPARQKRRLFQQASTFVREVTEPGSLIIGTSMYAAGRLTHERRLAEVGLHGTEALGVGALTGDVLKGLFGRARPFVDTAGPNPNDWQVLRGYRRGGNYQSFPSGHSTAAFAAAAAVSAQTSKWYPKTTYFLIGPVLYGGAGAVALSRMYNNRHWASDVILGAAIGIFAGNKVVRYTTAHPNNAPDRWLLGVQAPTADLTKFSLIAMPDFRRTVRR